MPHIFISPTTVIHTHNRNKILVISKPFPTKWGQVNITTLDQEGLTTKLKYLEEKGKDERVTIENYIIYSVQDTNKDGEIENIAKFAKEKETMPGEGKN